VSVESGPRDARLDCSAAFYVRSLAHDLGDRLGVGAHLRRSRRGRPISPSIGQRAHTAERILSGQLGVSRLLTCCRVWRQWCVAKRPQGRERMRTDPGDTEKGTCIRDVECRVDSSAVDPRGELSHRAAGGHSGLLHPSVVLKVTCDLVRQDSADTARPVPARATPRLVLEPSWRHPR